MTVPVARLARITDGVMASRVAIGSILLFAIAVRLLYIPLALQYDPYLVEDPLFGDAKGYDAIGSNLSLGNGFAVHIGEPTSLRPPLYPAFLALVYGLTDHSLLAARMAQAVLGTGSVFLVFLVARRLYGLRCGLLAAAIMALHPIAIYFATWLISETVFLFALLVTLWAAAKASDHPTVPWLVVLGMLQGVLALIRPQAVLLWPVLPLWAVVIKGHQPWRAAAKQIVFVLLVTLLIILPWTVRNYRVHGALVLIDTHGGWTLYGSYGHENRGNFVPRWSQEAAGLSEYQQDRLYYRLALQWIRAHPLQALRLVPLKVARLFSPLAAVDRDYAMPLSSAIRLAYAAFLALAAVGMVLSAALWRDSSLLYASMLVTIMTSVVFYGCTRFSLPMQPALAIFAALPVATLLKRRAAPAAVQG